MSEPAWVALGTAELEVDAVEHDEVTVAGVRLLSTKLVAGDAQPAFRIMGDGTLEWGGGGGAPPEIKLARIAANVLRLYDGRIDYERNGEFDQVFTALMEGETFGRFAIVANGTMQWGDGATARDINLKRNGPGVMGLDAAISFSRTSEANPFIYAAKLGDANARFTLQADGALGWGPGTGAIDTNLYRISANLLNTDDSFRIGGNSLYMGSNTAAIYLGSASDVNLYRSAADQLKTDDSFFVGASFFVGNADANMYRYTGTGGGILRTDAPFWAPTGLTTRIKAGVPVDADTTVTPNSGTIVIDVTNSRIYVRVGSVWKYATLT